MSKFNVKEFCSEPCFDQLINHTISKDEWKYIALHFGVSFGSSSTKEQIKNMVVEALANRGILPEGAIDELTPMSKSLDHSKFTCEEDRSDSNSSVGQDSWSEARLAFERERLAFEREQREKDREIEIFKLKQQERLEESKLEQQEKDRQLKIARIQQMEEAKSLEKERLELDKKSKSFNLSKSIQLVPKFLESEPEKYFQNFEKTAIHLDWPKSEWTWLIQPKLIGKAASAVNNLDDISDYEFVKQAVLDAYEITRVLDASFVIH